MDAKTLYRDLLYKAAHDEYGLSEQGVEPEELDSEIESNIGYSGSSFGWNDITELVSSWHNTPKVIDMGEYTVECVDHRSGGEEDGTVMWLVLRTSDAEGNVQYFRKDGYYASYDGGYWEGDFTEVAPKPRTVVFYE